MNMKSLAAAAAVLVASTSSYGATYLGMLDPGDSVSFSNTVSGSFSDTFTFDLSAASFLAASATNVEITFSSIPSGGITGFMGDLEGTPLTPNVIIVPGSPVAITVLVLSGSTALPAGGLYTLTMSGTGITGTSASYGGNLTVAAIPEPETYALMLAGLGAVGFVASRRRPRV